MSTEEQSFNPVVKSLESVAEGKAGKEDKISAEGKERGAGSAFALSFFNSERKRLFLEAARKFYPNITRCCQEIGISWQTFSNHRKQDKIFAAEIAMIEREVTDRIEGVLATEAVNPKSFLDRISYLRAHRPELYNPAKVVKVEGYKMGEDEKRKRLGVLENVIDAEIVKSYMDREEQRKHRQQQKLQSGGEPAGDQGAGGGK